MITQERRPGDESEATKNSLAADPEFTSSTAALDAFRGAYAVIVSGPTDRRHLYFNLPAATRAVARARARGARAELVLVKLVPVDSRYLDQEVGL